MAIGKITGSVVADNTLTESNLAFGVSGQSAASAWATDTLKVNIIESDDSTAIQLNDSLNISGTLSANIIDVNTITSGDSTAVEFQDNVSVTGSVIIGGYHPNLGGNSEILRVGGKVWIDDSDPNGGTELFLGHQDGYASGYLGRIRMNDSGDLFEQYVARWSADYRWGSSSPAGAIENRASLLMGGSTAASSYTRLVLRHVDDPASDGSTATTDRINFNTQTDANSWILYDQGTGKFGIGTNSPDRVLHISHSVPIIKGTDTDVSAYGEISFSGGSVDIRADEGNALSNSYIIFRNDGSEIARFDANGRLGIGDTSPSYKLDVAGDVRATGSIYTDTITTTGSNDDITISANGTGRVVIGSELVTNTISSDDSTQVEIQDGLYIQGSTTVGGIGRTGDAKLSVSHTAADVVSIIRENSSGSAQIRLGNTAGYVRLGGNGGDFSVYTASNTTARLYIDTSGNVGIGNNPSPAYTLDVAGQIQGQQYLRLKSTSDTEVFSIRGEDSYSTLTVGNRTLNIAGNRIKFLEDSAFGTVMQIEQDGKVGIGSQTPAYELDVSGDIRATGSIITDTITTDGSNSDINISANGTGDVVIGSDLVVNTIKSDDSTSIAINDSLDVNGTLNVSSGAEIYGTLYVQAMASEDSGEINVQDPMDISGYIKTDVVVTDFIRSDHSSAVTVNDRLHVDGVIQANDIAVNTITSPDSTGININEAQLYVNGQAVLNTGSGEDVERTTNTANVTDVIINNSGTIFRIPLANIDISSFNNDAGYAAGGVSGFSTSTTTSFPVELGDSAARDYGDGEPVGVGTGSADNTDAFGVALGTTYDCMEPNGSLITTDLGTDEAYVGA